MTDPGPDHARLAELAAAHALHALEPDDEQAFTAHARQCPHCQQALAGYAEVAAALAETAPRAEPSPQLGPRILAAALADDPRDDRPGTPAAGQEAAQPGTQPHPSRRVIPLRRRPQWHRAAAGAAAAAVIAAGTWAGLAATGGGSSSPQTLAACARPHACTQVVLSGSATQRTVAKVVIQNGVAWMEPTAMAANPAGEIYVLWQITGAHTPLAVGSFDIRPGTLSAIRIGSLAAPYSGTWAFAVSLEHGRTIPASPSRPVALGQVS
jgi:hypothetical protein